MNGFLKVLPLVAALPIVSGCTTKNEGSPSPRWTQSDSATVKQKLEEQKITRLNQSDDAIRAKLPEIKATIEKSIERAKEDGEGVMVRALDLQNHFPSFGISEDSGLISKSLFGKYSSSLPALDELFNFIYSKGLTVELQGWRKYYKAPLDYAMVWAKSP